jgi:tRNA(Arg) A34 adenosine deaminase TadA
MILEEKMNDHDCLQRSVELAIANATDGGEPFGAVLTRDGRMMAEGVNEAHVDHDPTAQAEIQALRKASSQLGTGSHSGATMYASGKPCAMCMAAMIQAGITRVVYCADDDVGGAYGFST